MYVWLAYLWSQGRTWTSRVNAGTMAGFIILSQSITGLYLGQGHLSDMLVGLLLGTLWLAIPIGLSQWLAATPVAVKGPSAPRKSLRTTGDMADLE